MPIAATVKFDLLDMAVLRLIVALSQHHALVGQEHGRTIPLAVLAAKLNPALGAGIMEDNVPLGRETPKTP